MYLNVGSRSAPPLWWANYNAGVEVSTFLPGSAISCSKQPIFRQIDSDEPGGRTHPIPVRLQICRRPKDLAAPPLDHAGWIFTYLKSTLVYTFSSKFSEKPISLQLFQKRS